MSLRVKPPAELNPGERPHSSAKFYLISRFSLNIREKSCWATSRDKGKGTVFKYTKTFSSLQSLRTGETVLFQGKFMLRD